MQSDPFNKCYAVITRVIVPAQVHLVTKLYFLSGHQYSINKRGLWNNVHGCVKNSVEKITIRRAQGCWTMDDNFENLKIMVIDDSKTIRRTAETLLKKVGCEVITATDGFDALAKIADSQPNIIFVDIMMPRLDGYQTCALIKNNSSFKKTPVIMLSSKDGLFDKAKGRIVGSDQYLTKPFSKDELLNTIRQYVPAAEQ